MEVVFKEKPALCNPVLLGSWSGMGMLASMSTDYLIQQLGAKQFAKI